MDFLLSISKDAADHWRRHSLSSSWNPDRRSFNGSKGRGNWIDVS